ncbi:MAG: isoprenylcysteine carboxylmethyltransferase family protein [Ignavibacteriaceae bacterium]|nr:isoprenylcysteine carboxylmethyltransferase family protein [Ignavibacteriaceae bacterium]
MNKNMNVLGVAPFIAAPTFLYLGLAIVITYLSGEEFKIANNNYTSLAIAGAIMIFIGVLMVISCGRKVLKSFSSGKLMTDGLYKIFRNPMYAAYLIFIIPGICLLFNSWLALTTLIINYVLFSFLIKREYKYLQEKFGKEYEDYLAKVFVKFL